MALVLPLVAVGSLTAFIASRSGEGGKAADRAAPDPATVAPAWQARADAAFRPITGGLVRLLREGAEWRAGQRSDGDFAGLVTTLIPPFAEATKRLGELPALEAAPRAKDLLMASARLYSECLRLTRTALEQGGDLRRQLDLAAQRLRIVADRVYDRARVAVDPKALESLASSSVDLRLPPDVPNWADTGLAAGPPLAAVTPAGADLPAEREAARPEQSEQGWRQAVEAAGIPVATDLVGAIQAGQPEALDGLATRLDNAAQALGPVADPPGGRERATTVRLGLLVNAEAARAAQAAVLAGTDTAHRRALLAVARRLVVIGDGLWDPALPPRLSGLDPALVESPSENSEE